MAPAHGKEPPCHGLATALWQDKSERRLAGMLLWLVFAVLTAGVVAALLWPLARPARAVGEGTDVRAVFRDQLDEIEAERARGVSRCRPHVDGWRSPSPPRCRCSPLASISPTARPAPSSLPGGARLRARRSAP